MPRYVFETRRMVFEELEMELVEVWEVLLAWEDET
jgi:hypothetical protein